MTIDNHNFSAVVGGSAEATPGQIWLPSNGTPATALPAIRYTTEQLQERDRRVAVLAAIREFLADNQSAPVAAACRFAGVDQATYSRWLALQKAKGDDGLIPGKPTGRKPAFELSPDAQKRLVQLRVKTGSDAFALQAFIDDPLCPEDLRLWVQRLPDEERSRHQLPPSLRKAMHSTPAVHDKFRGPKRYRMNAMTTLRGMFEEMADGSRREIEPGDWWVMDDMSVNYPFWFDNPFGTDKLAKAHGVGIGRQSLCAMDLASGKWLGFVLIGRPRDAYRAEDILRFCRRLFQEYGLPRRGLRLERGIWQAKKIRGHELVTTATGTEAVVELSGERPEMPEAERNLVIGGFGQLGLQIEYTTSAKGKGEIETGFGFLQRVMDAI